MSAPSVGTTSARRGAALVAALALLSFAAALLAGAAAGSRAMGESVRTERARLVADAEATRALALRLGAWSAADDSLAIRDSLVAETSTEGTGTAGGIVTATRSTVTRVDERLYLLDVQVLVGRPPAVARRALRLAVLAPPPDSLPPDSLTRPRLGPRPLRRWRLADLY